MKKEQNTTHNVIGIPDINKRFMDVLNHFGYSGYRMQKENTGIIQTQVSHINIGRNKPSEDVLEKLLNKFPDINKIWLLTGDGKMLLSDTGEAPSKTRNMHRESSIHAVPEENYIEVAYYDLETTAGSLSANNLNSLPDSKKRLVPREYEKGKYLVVRVSGDSMDDGTKRSVPNGTELLIREMSDSLTERLPIKNYLFVIVAKDGTVLKQIIEQNVSMGYLKCHSFNSLFQDYTIPFEDVIQIFKVLKKVNEKIVF